MFFTISSTTLSNRLQSIGRVISSKNNIPILDCFLFDIKENNLNLTASDGETTLKTHLELLETDGNCRFAINAKTVQDAMKEIPEQPLRFDINPHNMEIIISYQNGRYNLIGQNADEYPTGTSLDTQTAHAEISSELLLNGINRTLIATAEDDFRPVMTGIFFDLEPEKLTIVATNGHKLVCNECLDVRCAQTASFILPKKPATLLKNLLGKEHNSVEIQFNERNAQFTMSEYDMTCRLIEGNFPNYKSVIPHDNPNCATVDRLAALSALRRVLIFSNQTSSLVKLQLQMNQLTVSCQDIDFARSAEEALVCEYGGMPMSIGFKGNFLTDFVNNLTGEEVILKLGDSSRAGIIVPAQQPEKERILMLLMPMMLND